MNKDLLDEARFLAGHCRWLTSHGMEDDEDDSALLGSLSSILDKLADEIERLAEVGIKGEVKE